MILHLPEPPVMQPILGKRARQACIVCNARRVRCNVTESMPCRNCVADGAHCELRESRRGKHPRRRTTDIPGSAATGGKPNHPRVADRHDEVAASEALVTLLRDNGPSRHAAHTPAYPSAAGHADSHSDSTEPAETVQSVSPGSVSVSKAVPRTDEGASAVIIGSVFLGESTTLRYVHSDDADGDAEPADDTSPGSTAHLLYQVPEADSPLDTVGGPVSGHGSIADSMGQAARPAWLVERRRIKMQFLKSSGAFTYPPAETVNALLDAYFQWFHPCFAIVDEAETRQRYRAGTLSPLLLQAILFIGAVHGGDTAAAGNGDTADATATHAPSSKYIYYNRCKDLYDADYECDKVTIIQAVFLMSFWRSGPFLEKDTRHWLATAISLAQSNAMHRSSARVGIRKASGSTSTPSARSGSQGSPRREGAHEAARRDATRQLKQLRQRLWWSIYTREQQCAAGLGMPSRISDEDCDVALLQPDDFEFAFAGAGRPDGVAFQVGSTGMARILAKIIRLGYAPGRVLTAACQASLRQELRAWTPVSLDTGAVAHDSPTTITESPASPDSSTFYTRLLHLTYNNLLILLHRQAYISASNARTEEGRIALDAAAQNSRIVEDLVASPTLLASLRHAPLHVITNLFNTLCMHTIHLRRLAPGDAHDTRDRDATARPHDHLNVAALTIAEHRAKVCLLGLQELQRTWDVRNWILQLFFQYLDRSTAARLTVNPVNAAVPERTLPSFPETEGSDEDNKHARTLPGPLALPALPLTSSEPTTDPSWTGTVEGVEGSDPASADALDMLFNSPWASVPTIEEQQTYLFSQIETDHLALGEGGGLCGYWGTSDSTSMGMGPVSTVDSMAELL